MSQIDDFFRSRLDQMIDLRKPLAVQATHIPWQELVASVAHRFARQMRAGKWVEDVDLFGPTVAVVGDAVSNAGRPRLPMRLIKRRRWCIRLTHRRRRQLSWQSLRWPYAG